MPNYRQALEKLMDNPEKLKAWKKKYGEATLANFTKTSKRFSQKPVNEIKSRGIETPKKTLTAAALGVSTKKKTKKKDKTKVEIGKGASDVLENVDIEAKKPTSRNERKTLENIGKLKRIAKRGKNKEARLNRRADRIAARKGFEGAGEFNEDDRPTNKGLMKARGKARELMAERKQKGKDFWRNFGSQMVRGTQAPPRKGFDANQSETDFRKEAMKKALEGKNGNAQTPEEIQREAGEQLQYDSYINKFGLAIDSENKNLQNAGEGVGSFSPKDYIPEWKTEDKSSSQKYFDNWTAKQSPFGKIEDEEDSTPQIAMNKIYKQKRGY